MKEIALNEIDKGDRRIHVYNNLAGAYIELGKYNDAIKVLEDIGEDEKDFISYILLIRAYSQELKYRRKDYVYMKEKALDYIKEAKSLMEKPDVCKTIEEKGFSYRALGYAYEWIGEINDAIECHKLALEIIKRMDFDNLPEYELRIVKKALKQLSHNVKDLENRAK